MGQLVKPKVFFVGATEVYEPGLKDYLQYTGQMDFWETYQQALREGLTSGEALCSVYAKMCYKSLVVGKNANVKRVRDVVSNLEGCHDTGHGSVFEHCQLNFIVTDCSRVYTHEQVRHRIGWSYSQTSGRYCRLDKIDLVWSSLLDPVKDMWLHHLTKTEELVYLTECKLGLRKPPAAYPNAPAGVIFGSPHHMYEVIHKQDGSHDSFEDLAKTKDRLRWVPDDAFNFDKRKAITSAIRRIAPNGQSNEIGMSCNIRALRQTVQVRTARFAETEIRDIFNQVYQIIKARFPTIFYKARTKDFDGLLEVYGLKTQPFEIPAGDPAALAFLPSEQLRAELVARDAQDKVTAG
jgi:thymidylate synthase (FAD)